jgi:hypothetical protein
VFRYQAMWKTNYVYTYWPECPLVQIMLKINVNVRSSCSLLKQYAVRTFSYFRFIGCIDSFTSRPIYPGDDSCGTHVLWGWFVASLEMDQSVFIFCNSNINSALFSTKWIMPYYHKRLSIESEYWPMSRHENHYCVHRYLG